MDEPEPFIVAQTDDYVVVYKPRAMHSAPLREGEEGTLLAWCAARVPQVLAVRGRKDVERGLLHRLDRETEGLVLLAKNQRTYDFLNEAQEEGRFLKEYRALCLGSVPPTIAARDLPFVVESGFRPFGPGRRAVKPVETDPRGAPLAGKVRELALDRGAPYRTEILSLAPSGLDLKNPRVVAVARLARGFRHQVRCHLAWLGLPLAGDELYGPGGGEPLALSAISLSFPDPAGGAAVRCTLD